MRKEGQRVRFLFFFLDPRKEKREGCVGLGSCSGQHRRKFYTSLRMVKSGGGSNGGFRFSGTSERVSTNRGAGGGFFLSSSFSSSVSRRVHRLPSLSHYPHLPFEVHQLMMASSVVHRFSHLSIRLHQSPWSCTLQTLRWDPRT